MRRVLAGNAAIAEATAGMEIEAILDSGWSRAFANPASGERWLETYMRSERHGGGYPVLMRLPRPERHDWLELVAHSSHPAEIWVAAMALGEDPESYDALLSVLADAARRAEWPRIGIAATWSGITSPMNRRPILGKAVAEITTDAEHFERIATEASRLLARASAIVGAPFHETEGWLDAPHA
jgi:hypothetical protein